MFSECRGKNRTLFFGFMGHCLRSHMRFSAAWLLRLWLFGRDWWSLIFAGAYTTGTFHRVVPRLTFFPFVGLLKAEVKAPWSKTDWSSLFWSICVLKLFSVTFVGPTPVPSAQRTFRCVPYPREHPKPTGKQWESVPIFMESSSTSWHAESVGDWIWWLQCSSESFRKVVSSPHHELSHIQFWSTRLL